MDYINQEIEDYAVLKSTTPSPIANQLEQLTCEKVPMSQMLIGQMESSLIGFLIGLNGAKRVLEFGTFTGYSALVMAEQLPTDGEVHTIDINQETVVLGKNVWGQSEHAYKIHTHFGNGLDMVKTLDGDFDLIFIDADKVNNLNYFCEGLKRLSSRGIIIVDNALWSGDVVDLSKQDDSIKGIRKLNDYIAAQSDLYGTLLPIRDGVFLVRKCSFNK